MPVTPPNRAQHRPRGPGLPCAMLALALLGQPQVRADEPGADGTWRPLPPGTTAVLLVTGADLGAAKPCGCNGRSGGALYRPTFDAWLARTAPAVERVWLATGNLSPVGGDGACAQSQHLFDLLRQTGYRAAGLGESDLGPAGNAALVGPRRVSGFETLSANVIVHETGLPAFRAETTLRTAAGRIAIIGVSPHRDAWIAGDPTSGTLVTVPAPAAVARAVAEVRGQADLVILLASTGFTELRDVLEQASGIDIVVASNGLAVPAPLESVDSVPVLWLGGQGQILGRIALGAGGKVLEIGSMRVWENFPVDPLTGKLSEPTPPTR